MKLRLYAIHIFCFRIDNLAFLITKTLIKYYVLFKIYFLRRKILLVIENYHTMALITRHKCPSGEDHVRLFFTDIGQELQQYSLKRV